MTQDLEERTRHLKMKMKLAQQDRQRTPPSSSGMPSDAEPSSSRSVRRRDRHASADPSLNERGSKDRMGGHDRSISHDRVERMRERNYERGRDPERPHHRQRRHKGKETSFATFIRMHSTKQWDYLKLILIRHLVNFAKSMNNTMHI